MNSHKKYVVFFCINFLKVSKLFHKNSKIFQLLFFKSCILVNLVKTEVFYSILKEDYYSLFLFFYFFSYFLFFSYKHYFLFFNINDTYHFHQLNWQGMSPMQTISISFVYTELLFCAFPQSHRLIFTYCLKSSLLLSFSFLLVCVVNPLSILPSELFQGIICNIEKLKERNLGALNYWGTQTRLGT